eukprot:IDg19291t1
MITSNRAQGEKCARKTVLKANKSQGEISTNRVSPVMGPTTRLGEPW